MSIPPSSDPPAKPKATRNERGFTLNTAARNLRSRKATQNGTEPSRFNEAVALVHVMKNEFGSSGRYYRGSGRAIFLQTNVRGRGSLPERLRRGARLIPVVLALAIVPGASTILPGVVGEAAAAISLGELLAVAAAPLVAQVRRGGLSVANRRQLLVERRNDFMARDSRAKTVWALKEVSFASPIDTVKSMAGMVEMAEKADAVIEFVTQSPEVADGLVRVYGFERTNDNIPGEVILYRELSTPEGGERRERPPRGRKDLGNEPVAERSGRERSWGFPGLPGPIPATVDTTGKPTAVAPSVGRRARPAAGSGLV